MPVIVMGFVLAGSLAANGYQWLSAQRGDAPRPTPPPPASTAPPGPKDPVCAAQLENCLKAANGLAAGIWSMGSGPRPPGAEPPKPAVASDAASSGPRDGLCAIARNKMRDEWLSKKELIGAAMMDFLHDETKQKADAQFGAERVSDAMGLSGRERRSFETDYLDLEQKRVGDLAAIAAHEPTDWSRLLKGAQTLYQEEDSLVAKQLGADKLATFRGSEADRRITILSILATYADTDWEQATSGYGP